MRQNHQLGGRGDDVLIATGPSVTWYSEPGDDTYRVKGGGLVGLLLSSNPAYIDVNQGVIRGSGHDLLDVGSASAVGISTGDGDDVVLGGPTSNHIRTGRGKDTVRGRGGDDFIEGGPGDNRLYGGAGHDQLFAGSGDDVLDGGAGHDSGKGGGGRNTCVRVEHAGTGC